MRAVSVTEEEIEPCNEAGCPEDGEVDTGGMFPEKEVEQPAEGEDEDPEFVGIVFHKDS
jgi:hypothetical protein